MVPKTTHKVPFRYGAPFVQSPVCQPTSVRNRKLCFSQGGRSQSVDTSSNTGVPGDVGSGPRPGPTSDPSYPSKTDGLRFTPSRSTGVVPVVVPTDSGLMWSARVGLGVTRVETGIERGRDRFYFGHRKRFFGVFVFSLVSPRKKRPSPELGF